MRLSLDFLFKFLLFAPKGSIVRKISWISILGIGLGLTSLILVISVMGALNQHITRRLLAVEPHLTFDFGNSTADLSQHPLYLELKADPSYQVHLFESQDVILRTLDGHFRGAIAKGMTEKSFDFISREIQRVQKMTDPNAPDFSPMGPLEPLEIFIGEDLARSMGIYERDEVLVLPPEGLLRPPGETPPYLKMRVKKLISTQLSDIDSQYIFYLQNPAFSKFNNKASRVQGIELWSSDPSEAEAIKEKYSKIKSEYQIQTWKERNSVMFFALRLEKITIGTFLALASLIAGFAILSTMMLLISQKTREIGVLQALGLSPKQVHQLFLRIGLMLSSFGVMGGVFWGAAISLYLEKYPLRVLPDLYYDSQIPAQVEWSFVGLVVGFSFFLSALGLYFSTRSVTHISPTLALKQKG